MTKGKLKVTKRTVAMFMSLFMMAPLAAPAIPANAAAAPDATDEVIAGEYTDEGYHLVWHDEFSGDTLDTESWKVETHDPGWVNKEWQEYTSEGNYSLEDGILHIFPKAEKKEKAEGEVDVLNGKGFGDEGWTGATSISGGKATIVVDTLGEEPYQPQFQRPGLSLKEGHSYQISFKGKAADARDMELNVLETENWKGFNKIVSLGTEEETYSYKFEMGACNEEKGAIQFNLGTLDSGVSVATTVELSDIKLVDLTESGAASPIVFDAFDDTWSMQDVVTDGKAVIAITNVGTQPYDLQYQKSGLNLTKGHTYRFSLTAEAEETRKIQLNTGLGYAPWTAFKNEIFDIGPTPTQCSIEFVMGECEENGATAQVNLGNFGDGDSALTTVTLSDVSLVDLTLQAAAEGNVDLENDYHYTSARLSTQGKKDYTYGRFEARAKVPTGQGYLPAFWLMATDESNYGQWPLSGEIDIMEVMGQDTTKSYHTIHYGDPDHAEDQGTKVISDPDKDFAADYHVFTVDWEPGLITWYVDGEKVHETNRWATGKDDESTLTYPAPFDQQFYVILNLAIGGSWVGYPDQAVVDDMENQCYDIDYVRVYQKDKEVYEQMEAEVVAPEPKPFRAPDGENYVYNGDFSKDLKPMNSKDDNFELHLEKDAEDSTYSITDGVLTISPSAIGKELYSVQLKQNNVPMYRGWEYEVTYDAWADVEGDETRPITVDVKGPDRNWCLYLDEQKVNLTNVKTSYSHKFTIDSRSDANGVLEFNLGKQGSDKKVYLSNVVVKHVSGEEIVTPDKTVRADGNYVYNGSFDQGDDRMRYWDVETENKEAEVSVTNILVPGKEQRKRELTVKVVVPEGASELEPVVISQEDIAPITKGTYSFSFDAYKADGILGDTEGMKAVVSGKKYKPELGTEKQTFSYNLKFDSSLTREDSFVGFIFYRPGTYYLDNVTLTESALIKNGSFDSGKAGYQMSAYNDGKASFEIVNDGDDHETALKIAAESIGKEDWHIQVKNGGVPLVKDKYYKLSFDARATVARQISVSMQEEQGSWATYSGDKKLYDVTTGWNSYENTFQMKNPTDENVNFSVALGYLGEELEAHDIYLDNVVLIETDAEGNPLAGSEPSEEDTTDEVYDITSGDVEMTIMDLPNVDDITLDDEEAILAALDAYEKLTDEQKAAVTQEVKDKLVAAKDKIDEFKADIVADTIAALPAVSKITTADKKAIEAARKAYNALTADQKAKVSKEVLAALEAAENALKDAEKKADDEKKAAEKVNTDKAAAKAVTDAIAKLPAKTKVKTTDSKAIKAARAAYVKLTDAQKKYVAKTDLNKLVAAEEGLKIANDKAAALKVTKKINKLPAKAKVKTSNKKTIEAVYKAYTKLTKAQKKYVSAKTLKRLQNARAGLKIATNKAAAKKVIKKIKKLPAAQKVKKSNKKAIQAARKAYKALTKAQKKYVSKKVLKRLTAAEKALKKLK